MQDYKVTLDINEDDLKTKEFEINLKRCGSYFTRRN